MVLSETGSQKTKVHNCNRLSALKMQFSHCADKYEKEVIGNMTKTKSTKRALLLSALSLLMCVSMLVGSTFAWFTDSVTSGSNIIKSGKLEVSLLDAAGNSLEGQMIKWATDDDRAQDQILWEPGCTYNTEPFTVKNTGNLALKFRLFVNGITGDEKLLEVIDFKCMAGTVDLVDGSDFNLLPGEEISDIMLTGHMAEEAGNEYQNLTVENISISVIATQVVKESDSFGPEYDANAKYPGLSSGTLEPGQSAIEIPVTDGTNVNVGLATIPGKALAAGATTSEAEIRPMEYKGNFTIATGMESKSFNITVSNLKENNDVPVKVKIQIGPGMDPATVKTYHYSDEIACTYDPYDGYISFESATFSPFTFVYDAESKYVAPEIPPVNPGEKPAGLPVAVVEPFTATQNIEWGNYGQWSPTEGLEANLDAAYTFKCSETLDQAEANKFANWYCDFVVKLDKPLGANEIFLGGNYGDFGWVGFHNGDLTLEANTEIPLLGSVTSNPWTYVDVVQFVGEFVCGVGNVGNSLSDAKFTVMLRLTNPEDETEFYNVSTIVYDFATGESSVGVSNAQELQDALNNGNNVTLEGDIDLSNGLIIPGL